MISGDTTGQPMEYLIELLSDGDARITAIDRSASSDRWPVIVSVGGQVMLIQNVELEEGYEIDAMDGPVLMLQLALTLLEKGIADGPESLPTEGIVEVQKDEQAEPIEVSTTSAGGAVPCTLATCRGQRIANQTTESPTPSTFGTPAEPRRSGSRSMGTGSGPNPVQSSIQQWHSVPGSPIRSVRSSGPPQAERSMTMALSRRSSRPRP